MGPSPVYADTFRTYIGTRTAYCRRPGAYVDSIPEIEWADRLGTVLKAQDASADEAYRRRSYSERPCPECSACTLVRLPLPRRLRLLRLLRRVRLDLRRYACDSCGVDVVLRHREG